MKDRYRLRASALALVATCASALAFPLPEEPLNKSSAIGTDSVDAAKPMSEEGPLSRWLTLDEFSFSMRYRNSESAGGGRNFDGAQERSLLSGKFKLDKKGKYQIGFRASSGRYFNWAYGSFAGIGFPSARAGAVTTNPAFFGALFSLPKDTFPSPESRGWEFYMRELYLSASPIKSLTLEFGGLGIEHGAATEITTFDDDGFISGERIRLKDKAHLYFDEISATFGYFGDVSTPNFFARANRLKENNYRQALLQKRFGRRLSASAGYDWIHGLSTTREAVLTKVPESRILDSVRIELYQRYTDVSYAAPSFSGGFTSPPSGSSVPGTPISSPSMLGLPVSPTVFRAASGWSVSGEKKFIQKKWQLQVGYADIDRHNGIYTDSAAATLFGFSLNGDSYQIGKRVFARASYSPASAFTMFSFYTHEIDKPTDALYNAFNHQTWQAGATVSFKSLLAKSGLF